MTVDINLGFALVAAAQNQKEVTINDALVQLSAAMNGQYTATFSSNLHTIAADDFTNAEYFFMGTVSATGTLTIPASNRRFTVNNETNATKSIVIKTPGTTAVTASIEALAVCDFYCDGTNVVADVSAPLTTGTHVWSGVNRTTPVVLTDAATVLIDFSLANNFSLTLGGNRTLANPTNMSATDTQAGQIVVKQDGTGGRTLSLAGNWFPAGGSPFVFPTGANAVAVLSYYQTGASSILYSVMNQ